MIEEKTVTVKDSSNIYLQKPNDISNITINKPEEYTEIQPHSSELNKATPIEINPQSNIIPLEHKDILNLSAPGPPKSSLNIQESLVSEEGIKPIVEINKEEMLQEEIKVEEVEKADEVKKTEEVKIESKDSSSRLSVESNSEHMIPINATIKPSKIISAEYLNAKDTIKLPIVKKKEDKNMTLTTREPADKSIGKTLMDMQEVDKTEDNIGNNTNGASHCRESSNLSYPISITNFRDTINSKHLVDFGVEEESSVGRYIFDVRFS